MCEKESRKHWWLLGIAALLYLLGNLQKTIIPGATFPELQQIFPLKSAVAITNLGAICLGGYALIQLPMGFFIDRFGGARVLLMGGGLLVLGTLLSIGTFSYDFLLAARLITGIGAGMIYLSLVAELEQVARARLGFFVALVILIGYCGNILATAPYIAGIHAWGYHGMLSGTTAVSLLVFCIYFLCFSRRKETAPRQRTPFSFRIYLKSIRFSGPGRLILQMGILFCMYLSFQTILGRKFLQDYCSLSAGAAGVCLLGCAFWAALNGLLLVLLQKALKWGEAAMLCLCGFSAFLGAFLLGGMLLLGIRSIWCISPGILLILIGGNMTPLFVAFLRKMTNDTEFSYAMSFSNCFSYLLSSVLGWGIGCLLDLFAPMLLPGGEKIYAPASYCLVFFLEALLAAIAIVLSFQSLKWERRGGPPASV